MPFPHDWKTKPKYVSLPVQINSRRLCHNCLFYRQQEEFNVSTGMCETCYELNPPYRTLIPIRNSVERSKVCCEKCKLPIPLTNLGIIRNTCSYCMASKHLQQNCCVCDKYDANCWNHLCQDCRNQYIYFCASEGYFYRSEDAHNRYCWCNEDKYTSVSKTDT